LKNLLLAHPRRASETTLANIVFAQVHEQEWKGPRKSAKNLLWAHPPRATKTTLANIVFAQVHEQGWKGTRKIC
jgi:hypothetical protein